MSEFEEIYLIQLVNNINTDIKVLNDDKDSVERELFILNDRLEQAKVALENKSKMKEKILRKLMDMKNEDKEFVSDKSHKNITILIAVRTSSHHVADMDYMME